MKRSFIFISLIVFTVGLVSREGITDNKQIPKDKMSESSGQKLQYIDISRGKAANLKIGDIKENTRFRKKGKEYTFDDLKKMRSDFRAKFESLKSRNSGSAQQRLFARQKMYALNPKAVLAADMKKMELMKKQTPPSDPGTNPVIETVSSLKAQPGDTVTVYGNGFGTAKGSIVLGIASQQNLSGPVIEWNPGYVTFKIPDNLTGLLETTAMIKVRTASGSLSKPQQFLFEPLMEVVKIDVANWGDRKIVVNGTEMNEWFECYDADFGNAAFHDGGVVVGCSGTDYFCKGVQFRNGWVIDHIYLDSSITEGGEADLRITLGAPEAKSPEINISWWNSGSDGCSYWLEVYARGPKGTSYR